MGRPAVLIFLLLRLGPGLLPGKRLTVACYLALTAAYEAAAPSSLPLPLPVVPDQSCHLIDHPDLPYLHSEIFAGRAPLVLPAGALKNGQN